MCGRSQLLVSSAGPGTAVWRCLAVTPVMADEHSRPGRAGIASQAAGEVI